jgi:heterodisulfide reductase subunit C
MAITIEKGKAGAQIAARVEEISGVDLSSCYQCKKCTSGCPVGSLVNSPPSEIMRRLHLGADADIINSDILWVCVSCETCTSRCPMDIDIAAVMDALRVIAAEDGAKTPEGHVPLFNKAFLKTVEIFGRTYDMAMVAGYKLGSGKLMGDTEKFPKMILKRKIALLPSLSADRKIVKRIFDKVKSRKAGKK